MAVLSSPFKSGSHHIHEMLKDWWKWRLPPITLIWYIFYELLSILFPSQESERSCICVLGSCICMLGSCICVLASFICVLGSCICMLGVMYMCVGVIYMCVGVMYMCAGIMYMCVGVMYMCVGVINMCVGVMYICVGVIYMCVGVMYMCVGVMYMCVVCINCASFYELSVRFWYYSDSVIFFIFHFINIYKIIVVRIPI